MPRTEGRSDRESFRDTLIRETEKAYFFAPDQWVNDKIWLPKSQCQWVPDGGEAKGNGGYMLIPEWLYRQHDLEP